MTASTSSATTCAAPAGPTAPRGRRRYRLDQLTADMAAVLDAVGKPRSIWWATTGARSRAGTRWPAGHPRTRRLLHLLRRPGAGPVRSLPAARQAARGRRAARRSWYIGAFQLPVLPELAWRTVLPGIFERTLRVAEGMAPRPGHPADTLRDDASNGVQLYRANSLTARGDPCVDVPVQLIEYHARPVRHARAAAPRCARGCRACGAARIAAGHWAQRGRPT